MRGWNEVIAMEWGTRGDPEGGGILNKISLLSFTRRREFLLVEIIILITDTVYLREIAIWRANLTTQ